MSKEDFLNNLRKQYSDNPSKDVQEEIEVTLDLESLNFFTIYEEVRCQEIVAVAFQDQVFNSDNSREGFIKIKEALEVLKGKIESLCKKVNMVTEYNLKMETIENNMKSYVSSLDTFI